MFGALVGQLLAQLRLLAVHEIADTGAGGCSCSGADHRPAAPLVLIEAVAEDAAGKGSDARADGGLVGGLGAVCVRGAAGE